MLLAKIICSGAIYKLTYLAYYDFLPQLLPSIVRQSTTYTLI